MNKNGNKKKRPVSAGTSSNGKAALFTLGFCYLFVIAEITYKIKVANQICTWEIVLLFLMLAVYGIFQKLFSKSEVPCNFKGEPLPTGYSKPEKKIRNAFYRRNSLVYSLIFSLILAFAFITSSEVNNVNIGTELFFETEVPNFVFGIGIGLIVFPIFYLFTLMIEYVWYEYKVSQYNFLVIIRKEQEETEKLKEADTEEPAQEEAATATAYSPTDQAVASENK